jgi:hypothetical protein
MSEVFSLPAWCTVIILLSVFVLFVLTKVRNSKRKLTLWHFTSSALQAILAVSAITTGIDLVYWWGAGELSLPRTPMESVNPVLIAGLLLFALGFWVIYENSRGLRKIR